MNRYTELSNRLNRKPRSTTPDDDPQQAMNSIFYAVGVTCSEFEKLQMTMVTSFAKICTGQFTENTGRLMSIIGGVSSFNVKTEMIIQAASVYIDDDKKRAAMNRWVALTMKAASRRNDIAHGMAMNFQNENEPMKALLVPPYFDPRKGVFMSRANKEMLFMWDAAQIMDYCDAIARTTGNFMAFIEQLTGNPENPDDAWMMDPEQLRS